MGILTKFVMEVSPIEFALRYVQLHFLKLLFNYLHRFLVSTYQATWELLYSTKQNLGLSKKVRSLKKRHCPQFFLTKIVLQIMDDHRCPKLAPPPPPAPCSSPERNQAFMAATPCDTCRVRTKLSWLQLTATHEGW